MTEKILFVDDEPNILRAVARNLRKHYAVKTAGSGKEALELIEREGPFAVIISDMRMPGMSGAELLSKVKTLAPHTVRIMLTGNVDQQTAVDAIDQGEILSFLNKPISSAHFSNALEAGLELYRVNIAKYDQAI